MTILILLLMVSWSPSWAQDEMPTEAQSLEEGAEKLASTSETDSDWVKEHTKLNSQQEKVDEYKRIVARLIKQKNKERNLEDKQAIILKILDVHERLKKATREYNALAPKIRYRFPAKGRDFNRQYLPMKIQTIEQIEQDMGFESDLTRIRKFVQRKYSPIVKKDVKVERNTAGSFTQEEADEPLTKKRLRLER